MNDGKLEEIKAEAFNRDTNGSRWDALVLCWPTETLSGALSLRFHPLPASVPEDVQHSYLFTVHNPDETTDIRPL